MSHKPKRPYRLTVRGGRCVATFAKPDRARERATTLVSSGKFTQVWVRNRLTDRYEEFRYEPATRVGA